jgi:hypothetical protein
MKNKESGMRKFDWSSLNDNTCSFYITSIRNNNKAGTKDNHVHVMPDTDRASHAQGK